MKKKALSVLLVLCMVLTLLPTLAIPAAAETRTTPTTVDVATFDALKSAITGAVDGDVINVTENITITGALPEIQKSITLTSTGNKTLKRGSYTGILLVIGSGTAGITASPVVTLRDITIDGNGGFVTATAEAILVKNFGTNAGTATLNFGDGAVLQNCERNSNCGGIYIDDHGTLNMTGGSITGNTASYDGDVYVAAGGGVYVAAGGTFNMTGGSITGNTADSGGGVYVADHGTLNMTGGSITGNTADSGGGVYVAASGTFKMTGGSITGNTADAGGGVYVNGTFNVGGSANVTDNVKSNTVGGVTTTTANNVYLPIVSGAQKTITVTSALTGSIGVTLVSYPTSSSSTNIAVSSSDPSYSLTDADAAHFFSDKVFSGTTAYATEFDSANSQVQITATAATNIKVVKSSGGDFTSLSVAITELNKTGNDNWIIDVQENQTISTALPEIQKSCTILSSNGSKIIGKVDAGSLLHIGISAGVVASPVVTLRDITIDGGGQASTLSAVILVDNQVGGTATLNFCSGAVLQNFNMSGGSEADSSCGVKVDKNGIFNMNGGRISGNTTKKGGVYISHTSGSFIMNGGKISGNTTATNGGGVYVGGTFRVGGTAVVSGNTLSDGTTASNVYLAKVSDTQKTITIAPTLTTGASIGVTTETAPTYVNKVSFTNATGADMQTYFTSDNANYEILMLSNGTLQLKLITYLVTYDANGATGGSVPQGPIIYASGSTITVFGNTGNLVKTGYAFDGWNTKADGSGTAYAAGATFTITDNTTLYAKWTVPTYYTMTFDANGHGTAPSRINNVSSGTKISAPTAPTADGYVFGGWYKEQSCANVWDFSTDTVTEDTTLYAKWTAIGGTIIAPTTPAAPVIVDGKSENIGKQETTPTETKVTVDTGKLTEKLAAAAKGGSVVIPVSDSKPSATAQLSVKNIEDMAKKEMTLTVQTGGVSYLLPAVAVDTAALLKTLDATGPTKVPVSVTVTKETGVTAPGATIVGTPMSFTFTASYGGKTAQVVKFDSLVVRTVEVTEAQSKQITTAIVKEADGSLRHVPTCIFEKDGKWYAKMNSRTNSVYAFISSEQSFADAAGKWYEAAVNEMASRKVVGGRTDGSFDGDASITRAEFAAIVVRALGLPADGKCDFTDVKSTDWFAGAVGTAVEYGLVNGYTDGSFAPNAGITRQEAMAMVQRAAKVAEFAGKTGSLEAFTDAGNVSSWAKDAVAFNVGSGLIVGTDGKLNLNAPITRAQTAVVLLRLLQKAELVDVRSKI